MLYCSWDMTRDRCNCYFSFWTIFCPFTAPSLTAPKMKISKKMKKVPGDVIFLHKCNKNYDHMVYCSWDMAHDRCNYFSFWAIFCPFTRKMKISKKIKKKTSGIIIILHQCIKNHDHMQYCSWDMASDGCNCYFSFWAIFCPFAPNSPKKSKLQKNEKSTWR